MRTYSQLDDSHGWMRQLKAIVWKKSNDDSYYVMMIGWVVDTFMYVYNSIEILHQIYNAVLLSIYINPYMYVCMHVCMYVVVMQYI